MDPKEHFKHCDTNDTYISLHDCHATEIVITDNRISFYFENGFWIMPMHEQSTLDDTVRTDLSRVDFYFNQDDANETSVFIFRKTCFKKTLRETWDIQKLQDHVNNKSFTLEFLYKYKGFHEQIFECWLHFDKKPYHYECQLKLPVTKAVYNWNALFPNKKW